MMNPNDYYSLYTHIYREKPKAFATLQAHIDPAGHLAKTCGDMLAAFEIETAAGKQLDIIGEWVGMPRVLDFRLFGVYFTHDGLEEEGWDNGVWFNPEDSDTTTTTLNDSEYRSMIQATIVRNGAAGTVDDIRAIILSAYPALNDSLKINDNQNMTIHITYDESVLNPVQIGLLESFAVPFKPVGVGVTFNNKRRGA